ncbi:MAG TPA: hypothetical protein VN256_18490 [Pyrinomonadaceae bacterium]|nr:hypothetical protein [Pyrinomonadaceae bacterium]
MAERARERNLLRAAESFAARARETEEHVTLVRTILLNSREGSVAETLETMETNELMSTE